MKNRLTAVVLAFVFLLVLPSSIAADDNTLLVQGLEAYRLEDWSTALFFLRKASTLPENQNAETWYVLIMSEVFAGDYESVGIDGAWFLEHFPESSYLPNVKYQMARALFCTGAYQKAIDSFSTFCRDYGDDPLVPSALFWMAESLYQSFNFKEAAAIFERIVTEYPSSPKVTESVFRLDILSQREREEKLLYLLRVTGEEYLAAKEDYEKLIKQYQSEEAVTLRKNIREQNAKIEDLNTQLNGEVQKNAQLNARIADMTKQNETLLLSLEESEKLVSQYRQALLQAENEVKSANAAKAKADAEAAAAQAAAEAANAQAVEARLKAANAATAQANAEAAAANAKAEAANAAADAARKAAEQRPSTTIIYQTLPVESDRSMVSESTLTIPETAAVSPVKDAPQATAEESDEELRMLIEKALRLQVLLNSRD